jgi:hypothetical protein
MVIMNTSLFGKICFILLSVNDKELITLEIWFSWPSVMDLVYDARIFLKSKNKLVLSAKLLLGELRNNISVFVYL